MSRNTVRSEPERATRAPSDDAGIGAAEQRRDVASRSKAEVRRDLPRWFADRSALRREQARRIDTSGGNYLVTGFVLWGGLAAGAALAAGAGARAHAVWGTASGVLVGLLALAATAALASFAAAHVRRLLERQDRASRVASTAATAAIHALDARIGAAREVHGLEFHPRRSNF